MHAEIGDVLDALRNARRHDRKCSLLIGAGCSVKAGIPTAGGVVELIRERFPVRFARTPEKTYPKLMRALNPGERRDLIVDLVDSARINWAHIAIAQLMQEGYVDRVLTTNFDPLVARACALLGVFPAIYDFASSQLYRPADVPDRAIIHLHGQRNGFVLLNTDEEVESLSRMMEPVFRDAGRGRIWMVAGYSGENDPVFERLAATERFEHGLYWIGYKDAPPARHLRDRLLVPGKYAYYVGGHDADDFFVLLAQQLGCFPPHLLDRPFTYLYDLLGVLTPYTVPGQQTGIDVSDSARSMITRAIDSLEPRVAAQDGASELSETGLRRERSSTETVAEHAEPYSPGGAGEPPPTPVLDPSVAQRMLMAGEYEQLVAMFEGSGGSEDPTVRDAVAWACLELGNRSFQECQQLAPPQRLERLRDSAARYQKALEIKPDFYEALNNWGSVLADQAKLRSGSEADELFTQAGEKFSRAFELDPDKHEAVFNWGVTLADRARQASGDAADSFFRQAGEKYALALGTKPDFHDAFNNWGNALASQAKSKTGPEARELFAQAGEKFERAVALKPDFHEALYNWGNALVEQAEAATGAEADSLLRRAGEKYRQAIDVKPDEHEALFNWGNALYTLTRHRPADEAEALLLEAGEKYRRALEVKPDKHEAWNSWGSALLLRARPRTGDDRKALIEEAKERLLKAEAALPGSGAYNLACAAALAGEQTECRKWLEVAGKKGTLPGLEHLETDPDLDPVREAAWFGGWIAERRAGKTAGK